MIKYERFTERKGNSIVTRIDDWHDWQKLTIVLARLAEYEDIGSPEEFAELTKTKEATSSYVCLGCKQVFYIKYEDGESVEFCPHCAEWSPFDITLHEPKEDGEAQP